MCCYTMDVACCGRSEGINWGSHNASLFYYAVFMRHPTEKYTKGEMRHNR